jgi:Gpi18-like mannosyltransferase
MQQISMWKRLKAARWLWMPAMIFSATRLGVALIAYLAAPLIIDHAETLYHLRPPDNTILDVLGSRWDTGFYVSIAEEGYKYDTVPLPSVAFFPLLPLIMRSVMFFGIDTLVAGVLVTNTTLLLATMLFYRLVEVEWGEKIADRAIWYFLIFPTSFFGSAIYSESLFLFCAIGALYCARRGYWESAGLLGIFASLSRFLGLLVVPLLLVEWWMQRRKPLVRRPALWTMIAPAIAPLGTLAYMAYLWQTFGNPLAFSHASAAWGRSPGSPLMMLAELFTTPAGGWGMGLSSGLIHVDNWMDFLFVASFFIMGIVLLVQKRWSEGMFVTLGALIPLFSGLLMSQRRYMWVLFPAFVLLARWGESTWVDRLLTVLFLTGLALFTALFANGYWVA